MIKLETIHKEMNNEHVQAVAHSLHYDWMFDQFDIDDPFVKKCLKNRMRYCMGQEPTEEQVLAAQRLFHTRVETGQPWCQ